MLYHPGEILLKRYRVESFVGQGSFGEVYHVTHELTNAARAIKVLRRDMPGVGSEDYRKARERFTFEAALGMRLDHPHVIKVYEFEEQEGELFLIMEYAEGGSLKDRLARGELLTVDETVKLGMELCEGLSALHERLQAVHRDLKPSNILFGVDGAAKIADLGLAQVPGDESRRSLMGSLAGAHPGTPLYMSPEQASTKDYLQPSSDIFSLGCVLFEALTGKPYKAVYGSRVQENREDVPPWLDEIVTRALAELPGRAPGDDADKTKRYRQAGKVRAALEQGWQAEIEQREKDRQRKDAEEKAMRERARREAENRAQQEAEAKGQRDAEERTRIARREVEQHALPAVASKRITAWWPWVIGVGGLALVGCLVIVMVILNGVFRGNVPLSTKTPILAPTSTQIFSPSITFIPLSTFNPRATTTATLLPTIVPTLEPVGILFSDRTDPETPSSNLLVQYSDGSTTLIDENVEDGQVSKTCKYVVYDKFLDTDGDNRITFSDMSEIFIVNIDGTNRIRLTTDLSNSLMPSFSPDGSKIAYRSERSGSGEVWAMNTDGSSQKQLTTQANWASFVSWSPNGEYLAFYSSDENGSYPSVIKPDGADYRRLSGNVGNGWDLGWTIDNQLVFAMEVKPDVRHHFIVNPDGTGFEDVTGVTIWLEDRAKCGWPEISVVLREW